MKNSLLPLLAALTLWVGSAAAQTAPPAAPAGRPARSPQAMAAHQTKRLSKQLGLSADQTARVEQIMVSRDQEMQTLRAGQPAGRPTPEQRAQFQAGRAKYDEQLRQVLTPDQQARYAALQQQRRRRGPEAQLAAPRPAN